jgi:hypothetical protein
MSKLTQNLLLEFLKVLPNSQIHSNIKINVHLKSFPGIWPSRPSSPTPVRSSIAGHPPPCPTLGPFGPSTLGALTRLRFLLGFAHSTCDTFSLSCCCHVGPPIGPVFLNPRRRVRPRSIDPRLSQPSLPPSFEHQDAGSEL